VHGYRVRVRLPVPTPRDVSQLLTLVPRALGLLDDVQALLDRIEGTRQNADALIDRIEQPVGRMATLLDSLEPSLAKLQPTLERIADTTDPDEVEALVRLVDHLPTLVEQVERDIMPILGTLGSVAPDLHDLLQVTRELNEMLAKVPGFSRIKKRVKAEQSEDETDAPVG